MSATGGETAASEPVDAPLAVLCARREELASGFPRIALLLLDCADPERVRGALARIPSELDACLCEVLVVPPRPEDAPELAESLRLPGRALVVRVHRNPRPYGFGSARKAAFEYALRAGFDHVAVLRGDGSHPPEELPRLLHAVVCDGHSAVSAARASAVSRPRPRRSSEVLAAWLQNRILGVRLADPASSYRVYSRRDLERIPFQLDVDDRAFDAQILLQLRALGRVLHEVALPAEWPELAPGRAGWLALARACAMAFDYRLHQLHVTRRGSYLVDTGAYYTLKQSPTGSHAQLVEAIGAGSCVLDLGCSQGLLARPLRSRGVRVTGVDARRWEPLADELEDFFLRDLEEPLDLPTGRVFDCVVISDVIEHVRNRVQLLRSARRYLKPGGRLLISTPNVALWFYRLSLLVGRFEYGPRGVLDESHAHLYTRATFRREVERAGFHVLRERVTALPFEVVFESTGRSRLLRTVSRGYHALARAWPELFAYQFILEAEITTLDDEATTG